MATGKLRIKGVNTPRGEVNPQPPDDTVNSFVEDDYVSDYLD
jgi:hypothetical protein